MFSKTNKSYLNINNIDDDNASEEVFNNRFQLFRSERSNDKLGGGGLIAFKKHLRVEERNDYNSNVQNIWVTDINKNVKRINF